MIPAYPEDLYSDAAIRDADFHHRCIRDLGPVVDLTATGVLAVGRYADVRSCLQNHTRLVSSKGVALNETTNEAAAGIPLTLDPPEHTRLRKVLDKPLTRSAVEKLRGEIDGTADELIQDLVAKGEFDGIADLARALPVSIVSTLVGLPEEGRDLMLSWSAASNDVNGPLNARTMRGFETFYDMIDYAETKVNRHNVRPGSWAGHIYEAADDGRIRQDEITKLLLSYVVPSLETTISAIGHMLDLFGRHPDQWALLREEPALLANAVEEVLRIRTPVRGLARYAVESIDVGGTPIPAGRYVVLLYASANRDERKWPDPDRFDIRRPNAREHLAFGVGVHRCSGLNLAKLEITAILKAMVKYVAKFDVGQPTLEMNNIANSIAILPVTLR